MLNKQPIEKMDRNINGTLEVHSIWETIQGEGPLAGSPAVFVRLTGCNLQCPKCDTDYTSKLEVMSPADLLTAISGIRPQEGSLIVFTGGEPMRQRLAPAFTALLESGYRIQVETNGTLHDEELIPFWRHPHVLLVCSPKALINQQLAPYVDAFKFVLQRGGVDPTDGLPKFTLGATGRVGRPPLIGSAEIYVQPLDEQDEEKNAVHLQLAVESALKFGYRLCLQTHKIIGLP